MIKTWQERINYGSLESVMQSEIDELRAENERLRAEVLTDTARLRDSLALCLSSLQYAWGCIENSTEQEDAKIEIGLDAARAALGDTK